MARRSRKPTSDGVKGPSSALTEFLRSEGITDAFRQRREREAAGLRATATPEAEDEGSGDAGGGVATDGVRGTTWFTPTRVATGGATSGRDNEENENVENGDEEEEEEEDEEIIQMRRAARRKARAATRGSARTRKRSAPGGGSDGSGDSDDDDDYNENDDDDDDDLGADMKKFGEMDTCVDCGDKFELSVYSRFIKEKAGYLCSSCNHSLRERERKAKANQLSARRKRKKVAQALLNKTTIKIAKLQDVCIKKITENIEDVHALGDIGQMNLSKISTILSKNRSLNNKTISLFLSPDMKHIEFWDCSNVDSDSLNKIASFCPNLESLTLFMCGQLHNDNLQYFASNLKNLTSLSLNGPFLISDPMWQKYFHAVTGRLSKFEVRNTHRFGNDSLHSMLQCCGQDLTSLKLSRLDGVNTVESYSGISSHLGENKLDELEISYPTSEDLVTDDMMIELLRKTGASLASLNVDGCSALTERFLVEGVAKHCRNLTRLSMANLDQVSNAGFAEAFDNFAKVNAGGLLEVNLTKCTALGDRAVYALLNHSCQTLVELSINSLYKVSKDFLSQILTSDTHQYKVLLKEKAQKDESVTFFHHVQLPLLTYLDASFVRAVDNEILTLIGDSCPKLQIIEVYGDNRCNGKALFDEGLMVIGRQSDDL
ncbi:uncharacterized protein LODBEIA_P01780 [Lodderomyces beijingensis]|uniref:DNA repair protein rhp7 treble clef domain-containing protein n=1 Tax=Lodderomyces beijingensis TaxID=1775926 RepID=A0ABP0ZCN6_9ASCO